MKQLRSYLCLVAIAFLGVFALAQDAHRLH